MPLDPLLVATLLLAAGIVVLVVASDQLVAGAARLSSRMGIAPVLVGVVIIGFGTSIPELLVSLLAAIEGVFDLGVGNIVGSNLANVLLVLGAAAVVGPVVVSRTVVRREVPISLVAVLAFAWAVQGALTRPAAVLLAVLLVVSLTALVLLARRDGATSAAGLDVLEELLDDPGPEGPGTGTGREAVRALLGLAFTLAGAQMVVLGGGEIALAMGLSDAFVGLTIVAVGTSLPELAAAVQSVRRGATDLLVGNILGSNLFNALAVGPVVVWTGASLGRVVTPELAGRATLLMVVAVVAVSALLVRRRVARVAGLVLLTAYFAGVALMAG